MFREMRRNRQSLPMEAIEAILERNTNGVLAVHGDGGYPYAVPLNYVYAGGKLYFHIAQSGHKLDAILRDPRASFAVVDADRIVSEEYTSYFQSVIAFGRVEPVQNEEERLAAFLALVEKYSGDRPLDEREREVRGCTRALIVGMAIEHVTGKRAKELIS